MTRRIDVVGQRFGRLVVLADAPIPFHVRTRNRRVRVRCDCGNERVTCLGNIKAGIARSCGCAGIEKLVARSKTHGGTVGRKTARWYVSWAQMLQRCTNQNHKDWADYGGRGITVCVRWLNAAQFFADMGERPAGYTIERLDNSRGYEPGNCVWTTRHDQSRNRRQNINVVFQGRSMCLADACEAAELGYMHTYDGITRRGLTFDEILQEAGHAA